MSDDNFWELKFLEDDKQKLEKELEQNTEATVNRILSWLKSDEANHIFLNQAGKQGSPVYWAQEIERKFLK